MRVKSAYLYNRNPTNLLTHYLTDLCKHFQLKSEMSQSTFLKALA